MFFRKTVFFATIKIIWWNPGETWAGRRASHILSSSHCIHLSNAEIDHNSHLRWNSSITLPLIKCYSWKSAFPDLWVRAKSQNPQAVLSLRAECRIIPFCHSASVLKVGGPVRGQQSHWSPSHRWLCFVQSPLALSVLRCWWFIKCLRLDTSQNTLPRWLIMCLNGNTECQRAHNVSVAEQTGTTSWCDYIFQHAETWHN